MTLWQKFLKLLNNKQKKIKTKQNSDRLVCIFRSPDELEVLAVSELLTEHEIPNFTLNKRDQMHVHLTSGELELHIHAKNVILANRLIEKHFQH